MNNSTITKQKNNKNPLNGIDKFSGSFKKVTMGGTVMLNYPIHLILSGPRGADVLGAYTYLCSLSPDWELNIKHFSKMMGWNKDKGYKVIKILIGHKLITKTDLKEKGKYGESCYRVHFQPTDPITLEPIPYEIYDNVAYLKPKNQLENFSKIQHILPDPVQPDTGKPDTEIPYTVKTDTYITNINNINNKEGRGDCVPEAPQNPTPPILSQSEKPEHRAYHDPEAREIFSNRLSGTDANYDKIWDNYTNTRLDNKKDITVLTWRRWLETEELKKYKKIETNSHPSMQNEELIKNREILSEYLHYKKLKMVEIVYTDKPELLSRAKELEELSLQHKSQPEIFKPEIQKRGIPPRLIDALPQLRRH